MSNKYRVEQENQFLGHWTAHTPHEAIEKMLHSSYANAYNIDKNGEFIVTKNNKVDSVYL